MPSLPMSKTYQKQIVGILFADIVGYSKLVSDDQATQVADELDEFSRQCLTPSNHFLLKKAGDGLLVASYDPVDTLDIALDLRDFFRNRNWRRLGFSQSLEIRIGVHLERTAIALENGQAVDIHGDAVNSAARIEPVAKPNGIYCSEAAYRHLKDIDVHRYTWTSLGIKHLAKNFGEMPLYELKRAYESHDIANTTLDSSVDSTVNKIEPPKIRRDFTDSERKTFLRDGLQKIADYFSEGCLALEESDSEAKTDLERSNSDFRCEVFFRGKSRAKIRVWIAKDWGSGEIRVSFSDATYGDSYNRSYSVCDNGFEMQFESMMFSIMSGDDEDLTVSGIAKSLWNEFSEQLKR